MTTPVHNYVIDHGDFKSNLELSNYDYFNDHKSFCTSVSAGKLLTQKENHLIHLSYSQVPCCSDDILVEEKRFQIVEDHNRNVSHLRPTAQFLFNLGLALVKDAYRSVFEEMVTSPLILPVHTSSDEETESKLSQSYWHQALCIDSSIPLAHLQLRFYTCSSCQFLTISKISLLMHYGQGHLTSYGTLRCAICMHECFSVDWFSLHMLLKHNMFADLMCMPQLSSPLCQQCPLCSYEMKFPNKKRLIKHFEECFSRHQRHLTNWLQPMVNDTNVLFFNESFSHSFMHGFLMPTFPSAISANVPEVYKLDKSRVRRQRYGLQSNATQPDKAADVNVYMPLMHTYPSTIMAQLGSGIRNLKRHPLEKLT